MKKITFLTFALVITFALASVASAKEKPGKPGKPGGMGGCSMAEMDKDKDGNITAVEWDEFHKAMFKKMDKDNNGSLSKDEMRACGGPGADRMHEGMHDMKNMPEKKAKVKEADEDEDSEE